MIFYKNDHIRNGKIIGKKEIETFILWEMTGSLLCGFSITELKKLLKYSSDVSYGRFSRFIFTSPMESVAKRGRRVEKSSFLRVSPPV